MLPQISYIVAQAGADVRPPPPHLSLPIRKSHDMPCSSMPNPTSSMQDYYVSMESGPTLLCSGSPSVYAPPPPSSSAALRPTNDWAYGPYEPSLSPESSSGPSYPDSLSSEEDEDRWQELGDRMIDLESKHWEKRESDYRHKLESLRAKLKALSDGTYWALEQEALADLEMARDKRIADEECVTQSHMAVLATQYTQSVAEVDREHHNERERLKSYLLGAVDDMRKRIIDSRDQDDEVISESTRDNNIKAVFIDAASRINRKRTLRPQNAARRQRARHLPYHGHTRDELDADLKLMRQRVR